MRAIEQPDIDIHGLIDHEQWQAAAAHLVQQHPADIADIIDQAPSAAREKLFGMLPDDLKADVLAELEEVSGADVVEHLTNAELSDILADMPPDDAADVVGDLPDERSEKVLDLMEDEESEDVRRLLQYEEDTAGGIMTTDVVAMKANQTVAQALEAIAYFDTEEHLYYVNVVDNDRRMIGFANIWELLRERDRRRPLGELIHRTFRAVTVEMDQEEVIRLAQQYNLDVVPVLDEQGVLVGRITADDIIEVIEEEASEDILRLAGSDDAELEDISVLRSSSIRLPWLLVTLCGGFLVSIILQVFHARLVDALVLAAFVPVVLAMGGNAGIQASTLSVRNIALGGSRKQNVKKLLLRETQTGAIMGLACGVVIGLGSLIVIRVGGDYAPDINPLTLAATVAIALFAAMTFAAAFGALIPIALDNLKIDPAVASGPFITITNDLAALLIYFGVTVALLGSHV